MKRDYDVLKQRMLTYDIKGRGIIDKCVLDAFAKVPRHAFVDENQRHLAYEDYPLQIRHGQTISQPFIVAYMTEALNLKGDERVLEIGTGSGYQAAILAECAQTVYTVERLAPLQDEAKVILTNLGYTNIHYSCHDGVSGWLEEAPFDAVMVTAAAKEIPDALLEQLGKGGRLIMPVGGQLFQELVLITRRNGDYEQSHLGGCRFVPLIKD